VRRLGAGYAEAMPGWLGPWEIVLIVAVVVLLFGVKRVPEIGRSLGRGMREVKDATSFRDDTAKALEELNPKTHVTRALTGGDEEKEKEKEKEKE